MRAVQCLLPLLCLFAVAQAEDSAAPAPNDVISCVPVAERAGRTLGCFVLAREDLGKLPGAAVYWHLYSYPTRAAAEAAAKKKSSGRVVESFGKVWLLAIGDANWNASGGQRVARVGPLPVSDTARYTAEYMEATFMPGMRSRVHRHPGPEAWYVLAGEQCLETPGHKAVVRAGESGVVPEGPPMQLTGLGTSERRSLALILHDTTKPMTTPESEWQPEGLCTRQ